MLSTGTSEPDLPGITDDPSSIPPVDQRAISHQHKQPTSERVHSKSIQHAHAKSNIESNAGSSSLEFAGNQLADLHSVALSHPCSSNAEPQQPNPTTHFTSPNIHLEQTGATVRTISCGDSSETNSIQPTLGTSTKQSQKLEEQPPPHKSTDHQPTKGSKKASNPSAARSFTDHNKPTALAPSTITSFPSLNHADSTSMMGSMPTNKAATEDNVQVVKDLTTNNINSSQPASHDGTELRTISPPSMPLLTSEHQHGGGPLAAAPTLVTPGDGELGAHTDPQMPSTSALMYVNDVIGGSLRQKTELDKHYEERAILPVTSPVAIGASQAMLAPAKAPSLSFTDRSSLLKKKATSDLQQHECTTSRSMKRRESSQSTAETDTHQLSRDDMIPAGLRNKKMRPTDCLLFAATLLEEDSKQPVLHASSRRQAQGTASTAEQITGSRLGSVPTNHSDPETLAPAGVKNLSVPRGDEASGGLTKPREDDVLCGRGGLVNKHPGNIVYRKVVDYNKNYYQSVHKKHRILVSQSIVQSILNFGGRFLTLGSKGKSWIEIGYKRAVQKTSQALRERSSNQEDDECDKKGSKGSDVGENGEYEDVIDDGNLSEGDGSPSGY